MAQQGAPAVFQPTFTFLAGHLCGAHKQYNHTQELWDLFGLEDVPNSSAHCSPWRKDVGNWRRLRAWSGRGGLNMTERFSSQAPFQWIPFNLFSHL